MSNYRSILLPLYVMITFIAATESLYSQQKSSWVLNRVLNADNGLPENSITDLYFDHSTGFLWIATEGGLVNYNGVNSKIFDTRNMPLRTARMSRFLSTTAGEVIAVDKSDMGVLIKGNKPDEKNCKDYKPFFRGTSQYQNLLPIGDNIFFSKYDSVIEKIGSRNTKAPEKKVLFLGDSTAVVIMPDSILLVGGNVVSFANPLPFPDLMGTKILLTSDTTIALLDHQCNGLFLDVRERKTFPVKLAESLILNNASTIYTDNINQIHYFLNGKKLYQLSVTKHGVKAEMLADLPELPDRIMNIAVHSQKNQVYIGTLFHGVYIYNRSHFYTYQCKDLKNYTGSKILRDFSTVANFYASVLVDSSSILLGYMQGYPESRVVLLNLQNNSFDFPTINMARMQFESDGQRNIYIDNHGLCRYSFTPFSEKPHRYHFPFSAFFYDHKYDRVTVLSENVLAHIENDSLRSYMRVSDSIASKITVMKRTGGVFIAFGSTTVFSIDEEHKKIEKIFDTGRENIRDVLVDHDSLAWITTYGKGIYMYDLKAKKLHHPKPDSKEYLLFAHYLAEDGHGNYFIPTNNGLFYMNRKALIDACIDSSNIVFYHYFDKTNGLLQNEFNGGSYPASNKLSNGDLLFSSINGLVRVFTSSIRTPDIYPLFIQNVASRSATYGFTDNMVFNANERALTWEVNFAQWEYQSTSGLSYRLDDDSAWTIVYAGERKILLTDLSGGKHTLQLRNQFDLEGKKIARLTVNFYIGKKYFEQAWFWILTGLLLIATIYVAVSLRNYQLKRQNVLLERKIHKQTQEVRNKNAELQVAMTYLQKNSHFQQKLIGLLGHDIMIPLRYISKVSKQLITYKNKLSEETVLGTIGEIDNTSLQLLYLGESIIQWIKLHEDSFLPKYSEFNLHEIVSELLNLHQPLAADKKNSIRNEVPPGLSFVQEVTMIKIILHNLLLNANKFTSKGEIIVSAQRENNLLKLTVKDTGIGMDEDQVANLNSMKPVSSKKGTDNETGWGLGYRFIIDLVKFIKGEIAVQSKKGEGTTVNIKVAME